MSLHRSLCLFSLKTTITSLVKPCSSGPHTPFLMFSWATNILSYRIWSLIKTRSFFMSMRVPLFKNPKVTLMNLQIHHPLVFGKCNKFTSFLVIYVIMVGCKCSWLSKYFCTSCCTLALTLQLESMKR